MKAKYIKEVMIGAVRKFLNDRADMIAGYISFSVLLAFFPFLIFITALSALILGTQQDGGVIDYLFNSMPVHVARTLAPVVEDILKQDRGGLATLSAMGALWAASSGFEALRGRFDVAYRTKVRRNYAIRRLQSIGMVFMSALVFVILSVLIVLGPLLWKILNEYIAARESLNILWNVLRYGIGLGLLIGFLYMLHRLLPSQRVKIPLMPGILCSAVLWMMTASVFSLYMAHVETYSVTYGSLSGIIITLLFFYITAAAILFGAEVNAVHAEFYLKKAQKGEVE
jgi:membrane protein